MANNRRVGLRRISLRSMFLLLAAAALLPWLVHLEQRHNTVEDQVVKHLKQSGVNCAYYSQLDSYRQSRAFVLRRVVRPLRGWFGDHFADRVCSVALVDRDSGSKCAGQIARLRWIKALNASDTDLRDSDLEHLADLYFLQTLSLANTEVTDNGVSLLVAARDLWFLDLSGTRLTDRCVPHLCEIPQLELLDLRNTALTADGIETLHAALADCEIIHDGSEPAWAWLER